VSFDELRADVQARDVSEPHLYHFIRETDSHYHKVDTRLHRQVLVSDRQATKIVHLHQEVAQSRCQCNEASAESPTSQPRSVYGNEEGREVYGLEYSVGAVGSGSNSTGGVPVVDQGNLVLQEVRVEEVAEDSSVSAEPEVDGQEAMLALVEQEMLEHAWVSNIGLLLQRKS